MDFTRCILGLRSQRLQQLAKRSFGHATAAVYGALLRSVEGKVRAVRDDLRDYESQEDAENALPVSTIAEIAEILDPTVDLGSSIDGVGESKKHLANGLSKKRKKGTLDETDPHEASDSDEDNDHGGGENGYSSYRARAKRFEQIDAHLALLAEHGTQFCRRARAGSSSTEWRVPFPALTEVLVASELDATILARHGPIALRIVRLLRERGRLEEKTVASAAMMRIKDVRGILTELQFAGLLEAQELPKDNTRQPSRTIYLWYFDSFRVQNIVVQQCYKAMARTLRRVEVEKGKYRTIIEKAERSDIKGQESEKLGPGELGLLRQWREVEERLLSQVGRMDEVVCLLRDVAGSDVEMMT